MLIPRIIHYGSRSQDDLTLVVPKTMWNNLGDRAFRVAASKLWNSLPKDVRSCNDVGVLKSKLKTRYFGVAYNQLMVAHNLQSLDPCVPTISITDHRKTTQD